MPYLQPTKLAGLAGPGLVRRVLFGAGRNALSAAERPIITASGAVDHLAAGRGPARQGLKKFLHGALTTLTGDRPIDQLRQRFIQGGVVGRGGVMHGSLAFDSKLVEDVKQLGLLRGMKANPAGAINSVINPSFILGIPTYAGIKAHERGESPARAIGEGLGFAVGAPFNALSAIPARIGGMVATQIMPSRPRPPNQLEQMQYQEAYPNQYPEEKMGTAYTLRPVTLRHR